MTPSDEERVEKVLAGQKDAFAGLVEKYKDAVYGLAYAKVGNFEDAQDIARMICKPDYRSTTSATHFYNPRLCSPKWEKEMKLVGSFGNHLFLTDK